MTTARSRARAFMWRRTASSRRCDSAQKTPLRWLENGSGSPVATNAMPTPEPRYSNPASSSGSVMPRSSFAIGVLAPNRNAEPSASIRGGDLSRGSGLHDSPLEGNGFEISVPRQIGSGFEASVGLGPIDSRRGKITRAVVDLGKPLVFRRLKEPPLTRRNEGAHAVGGGEASRN